MHNLIRKNFITGNQVKKGIELLRFNVEKTLQLNKNISKPGDNFPAWPTIF